MLQGVKSLLFRHNANNTVKTHVLKAWNRLDSDEAAGILVIALRREIVSLRNCSQFDGLQRSIAMLLLLSAALVAGLPLAAQVHTTWSDYLGGSDSAQYSGLTQINKSNVGDLQLAWFFPAGSNNSEFGFNPIAVDNVMYVLGKNDAITAVDVTTGQPVWVHEIGTDLMIGRGINYWETQDRSDRRLIYNADNCIRELDARTGKEITAFGDNGCVDLRQGLGRDPKSINLIQSFTPGRVFEDLIIVGSATGEEYGSPPGDIRAYKVRTGQRAWIFHTVPHPGEPGYETWPPDAWTYVGGTNTWGELSVDAKRGIVYAPTGAPTYDFYGADRKGANLFSDCLLALNARTGKYLWHFQFVHHDLWDYDAATAPKLITVHRNGQVIDAVAQATKQGFLFVFDRVSGKSIWPIEERPVPKSDVPGEQSWPTQPFPTAPPPFARQKFTADDINPYITDPQERDRLRDTIFNARNEGLFTPPALRDTVQMPGNGGGANWGGAAVDLSTGTLYVESKDAPTLLRLEAKPPKLNLSELGSPVQQGKVVYALNCKACHGEDLSGHPPLVPSLLGAIQRFGADHIRRVLKRGAPPMPSFASLSAAEVDALMVFLADPEAGQRSKMVLAWRTSGGEDVKAGSGPKRYWSGYGYLISSDGLPDITPPWTTLTAYELNQGTIRWQVPLGEMSVLAARGIRNLGSRMRGGVVVTAGGIIFAGTQGDRKLRAYDKDTGMVLWEKELPARPNGVPAVFEVAGREYVVICATETQPSPTEPAKSAAVPANATAQGYYVFALPARSVRMPGGDR
jgi:quinoprotein glucose dehydrogenase